MRITPTPRAAFLAASLTLFCALPASAAAPTTHDAKVALGKQAYRYGFPLLEFERVRATETSVSCPGIRGNAPVNHFSNAPRFATPKDRSVVAPNVDTLYSIAQLDLAKGPIVLTHPNMGKRYFVFEFVDPYTNVVGYIGSRATGSKAGRFAITWTRGAHAARAKVPGTRVLRSRYRRLWVIGRTLAGTKPDQKKAYALMRQYTLARAGTKPKTFHCTADAPTKATTPTGLAFLAALGRAMRENPPPVRDSAIVRKLAAGGIGPGRTPTDPALAEGVDGEAQALPLQSKVQLLTRAKAGHGWLSLDRRTGAYGTNYALRELIAAVGLGANTPIEAIYPVGLADATGALFDGSKRYRLVFTKGTLPPAKYFWSLTMYDGNGFLVPNAAHRYAIGSSHPGLVKRKNGGVVVVIQRTRPTEAGVNWLPAPAGNFRLNLRLYGPSRRALSGAWTPPPVQPVG